MPQRSVLVTYTLHPSPTPGSSNPIQAALNGIRAQIPLRNLHWKSSSRTALRTIQEVSVTLLELGEAGSVSKEIAGSILDWPLVNLCLVVCEDAELYRTQTRSFIRDWLSLLAARRSVHAPLIVLVNPTSSVANSGKNVFGRDKGVLGKLKADFNTGKRDRSVAGRYQEINLPPTDVEDLTAWPEIINKLKESIMVAFDGAILEREEEVKRGEAQRSTVGWNFCTWFLLKESLAHSFEGVNLHEDALIVYEELEAAFFQVLKEQNLSWFGKLGATGAIDDSLPVLDTTAKPYRTMLQTNLISIFDFRIYVFARQAQLLGKLGRITEIAKRGQWFVASLTRRLRESEADLAENFIEAWTYTACLDIVQRCDEWSRIDRPNGDYTGLIAYESARSELLDIARVQVERIGIASGHLPNVYPFIQSSALVLSSDDVLFESSDNGMDDDKPAQFDEVPPRMTISNRQLIEAMGDVTKFRNLYLTHTKKAILAYEACGKVNSVLRLKADLAGLALHTKDWSAADELCRNLVKDCTGLLTWEPVTKYALEGALRAHRELHKSTDDIWIDLALTYMRVCVVHAGAGEAEELGRVLAGFRDVKSTTSVSDHKAFHVLASNDFAEFGEDADVTQISIVVQNLLPFSVAIDTVRLEYENREGASITFMTGMVDLQSGDNQLSLSCLTSTSGQFLQRSARLDIGELAFTYDPNDETALLHIRRNLEAPRAALRMPYDLALDEMSQVVVEIHTRSCSMTNAHLALSSVLDEVRYLFDEASCEETSISANHDGIAFGDLAANTIIHINIPYDGAPQGDSTKARIDITYESGMGKGQTRLYQDVQTVSIALPLTVNAQDFFLPKWYNIPLQTRAA
ncbi:MAG: hypothetical protein TREMPRED_004669, partial [Tremellales sp. Tagirdzhanova-0007]